MFRANLSAVPGVEELLNQPLRWVMRQAGAGADRFFREMLTRHGVDAAALKATATALSERDAASRVALGQADIAPGARSAAAENGLGFIATGWECFDIALDRSIYFRKLLQNLIARIQDPETADLARMLGGYDLSDAGKLVWGQD